MIFDNLGLPKENGADDLQDSARLAGLVTLFNYDIIQNKRVPIGLYVKGGKYVRHPNESKYDFSRDQALCLMAGLYKDKVTWLVGRSFIDGKDLFTPSHMGHIARCQGKEASFIQNLWLKADILFHAKFTPTEESNQLIAMMMVAGPDYVRLWKKHNYRWRESIINYWCGWRSEVEFARHMIETIEKI